MKSATQSSASRNTRRVGRRIAQHIAALGSNDKDVSQRAEAYLIRYYAKRAVDQLIPECENPNPVVRFRAAWILGKSQEPRAFEAIWGLMDDLDGGVRYDATIALGMLGDLRAVEHLMAFDANSDSVLYGAAITGLTAMGAKVVVPMLSYLGSDSAWTRIKAATILGRLGNQAGINLLKELIQDPNEQIRNAAQDSLEEFVDEF